jgi:hypothetical protein
MTFRGLLAELLAYESVGTPLVYTQVVNVAVRSYFFACLLGRQYLDPNKGYENSEVNPILLAFDKFSNQIDIYIPPFTILQLIFYVGWLKTGEALLNPMGDDDDDFDLNCMIDRNMKV